MPPAARRPSAARSADPDRAAEADTAASDSIWARPERSGRGPTPAHTRDEITAIAVRIADDEGLAAVSMRRVATEVGAGTTSLYRYFSKKSELFELMADAVVGELPLPPLTGDWIADLRAVAVRERDLLRRHPWYLTVAGPRPVLGPNNLRFMDHTLAIVEDLGLDIDDMLVTVSTVLALVRGYLMNELAGQEATRLSGLDEDQWMDEVGPYARTVVDSGEYPRVARVILDAAGPHSPDREDRAFMLGLDRVLDGLAASLPAGSPGPGGRRPTRSRRTARR